MKKILDFLCELWLQSKYRFYIVSVLWAMIAIIIPVLLIVPKRVKADYQGAMQGEETDIWSLQDISYSYYLDYSPSMMGFFVPSGGTMPQLADVMQQIEKTNIGLSAGSYFYHCGSQINSVDDRAFYRGLRDVEDMLDYYQDLEDSGISLQNGVSGGYSTLLSNELDRLDLSMIFTQRSDNNRIYESAENNLNVILTDLNFLRSETDKDGHDERMQMFAQAFAEHTNGASICIYCLESIYQGKAEDSYSKVQFNNAIKTTQNKSFLMIVEAKSNKLLVDYTEALENAFQQQGISYENKFLISMAPTDNSFPIDETLLYDSNMTVRSGFNYDNKSLMDRPEHAIGLRMVRVADGISSIRMPIARVDDIFSGTIAENATADSRVEVKTTVFYRRGGRWSREGREVIPQCNAYINQQGDDAYLYMNLTVDNGENRFLFLKPKVYVIEVQFLAGEIAYRVPEWSDKLNGESNVDLGAEFFFRQILEVKGDYIAQQQEEQRKLGRIEVYILY